ncbi:hypothetical protein LDENG_00187450 [Lucifuga dentata]|nr:hypothetical protein LDENG_00187450 [Lucifuga dentata]
MLWEMIVSNITCMTIEYIRLKHAKWWYGPLSDVFLTSLTSCPKFQCLNMCYISKVVLPFQ